MSVIAAAMYVAKCDYPGCGIKSSDFDHGNNTVYDSQERLAEEFVRHGYEGSLESDYGWLRVGEKHFCGEHVVWDEAGDERIPMPEAEVKP